MKYKLFVLTILSTVGFYNYHGIINPQVTKALFYLNMLLCIIWSVRDGADLRDVKYPRRALAVMLGFMALSCVTASAFHSQSLVTSIVTTLPMIAAYGFFWVLMKMDIPRPKIINTYIVLCAIASVVYFCNVLTMPNNIFGEPIINEDLSRGIVRIPVVFIQMFPLLVFYAINRMLITKEKKWLVVIAWCVVMIFLSVIRQVIALTLVLGAWFYFRRISAWSKVLLAAGALAVVMFVLPMIPMYNTMIELSEDQRDSNEQTENIRITSWRYYTYDNQTNAVTPILGNGMPALGNSLWGRMFDSETEVNGCFAADVGWAGYFWHFGAIATIALIVIMAKALARRKSEDLQYLNYWLIYLCITSVASGPVLYFHEIMCISVVWYLVFKKNGTEPSAAGPDGNENALAEAAPQQSPAPILPKYPQLR